MKAISLHQPYANVVALGLKRYETRSWGTSYRGPLAICSAKKWTAEVRDRVHYLGSYFGLDHFSFAEFIDPPLGAVVALVDLVACVEMTPELIEEVGERERKVGDWKARRFAWQLDSVRRLESPLPIRGRQGLWNLDEDQAADVWERVS